MSSSGISGATDEYFNDKSIVESYLQKLLRLHVLDVYDKTKFNLVYFFYFSEMVPLHVYKCQTWVLYSLVKENRKWYSKFNKGVQTPKTTIMEEKGRACVL